MAVRWGIIGCGDVTEVKSGPAFQLAEGSELVAVMRRDEAKARDYADRHHVPKWSTDADKVIRDPGIDAIYVATPVSTHMSYAMAACEAGKPCYVEKPMARNYHECRQMVDAFAQAGLPLFVAYYRRALPRFVKTRQLVEEGALGRITNVMYRLSQPRHQQVSADNLPWRLQAEHSGGGIVLDLASHLLDVVDYMLGPLSQVSGTAANIASAYDVEDTVAMQFSVGGAPGVASWNFASPVKEDMLEITGTDGRVSLSCFEQEPVRLETADGVETFDLPNPKHVQLPLVQMMVDQLNGKGRCPSTGETASRTNRVLDTVLNDYYGGRDDAFWARPDTWPGRRNTVNA